MRITPWLLSNAFACGCLLCGVVYSIQQGRTVAVAVGSGLLVLNAAWIALGLWAAKEDEEDDTPAEQHADDRPTFFEAHLVCDVCRRRSKVIDLPRSEWSRVIRPHEVGFIEIILPPEAGVPTAQPTVHGACSKLCASAFICNWRPGLDIYKEVLPAAREQVLP